MIAIRADANKAVATGHLMRCLSIAGQIKKRGADCMFITADDWLFGTITANGFKSICLGSPWHELDDETEQLVSAIKDNNISTLLVDSYFVTEKYLNTLGKYAKIAYIDDLNMFRYPVDFLINYNNYYELFDYASAYRGTDTKLLLGCQYAPLREEFQNLPVFAVNERVNNVMVTTGGADEMNVTGLLLERISCLRLFPGLIFHVVVGRYNNNAGQLKALAEQNSNIRLYFDVAKISRIMLDADIAVSASGSTLYELCACGLPAVCFTLADNQLNGAKGFAEAGLLLYAGDCRDSGEKCIEAIIEAVGRLQADFALRAAMSRSMQNLVDGGGAKRLAEVLCGE